MNINTSVKHIALANFLQASIDDIKQNSYDDSSFTVNPRPAKSGTSPAEYKRDADRLHRVFKAAHIDAPTIREVKNRYYDKYEREFIDATPECKDHSLYYYIEWLLEVRKWKSLQTINSEEGIYPILNPLYSLLDDHDNYSKQHITDLRDAFEGREVEDHRRSYTADDGEYLVLTDSEREDRAEDYINSYIDNCLEIPDNLEPYFDRDKFKHDVINIDGYGHALASYDGEENEIMISQQDLYNYVLENLQTLIDCDLIDDGKEFPTDPDDLILDDDSGIGEWLYIYRTN